MTARVSVSQQSTPVNPNDADKDLYFDWTCAKLLILYVSNFKYAGIMSDTVQPENAQSAVMIS